MPQTVRKGAHHVSVAFGDPRLNRERRLITRDEKLICLPELDRETFDVMWEMSKPESETEGLFLRIDQKDYHEVEPDQDIPVKWMPNVCFPRLSYFRIGTSLTVVVQFQLLRTDLAERTGVLMTSFTTVSIDTPVYLPYLLSRFLARGGNLVRSSLQHISQVLEGALTPFKPDALVTCVGIGARFLGGIEDKDIYPIRGQTVLIRAPWMKFGRTINGKDEVTYIIPRRSGDVSQTAAQATRVKCLAVRDRLFLVGQEVWMTGIQSHGRRLGSKYSSG